MQLGFVIKNVDDKNAADTIRDKLPQDSFVVIIEGDVLTIPDLGPVEINEDFRKGLSGLFVEQDV